MPEFIYQLSGVELFIFLNIFFIATSFIAIRIISAIVPLNFRYKENAAIINCSALLGIIYAVLVGFIILYQLNSFDKAAKEEESEAAALYSIYHNALSLNEPASTQTRRYVMDYVKNAIQNEWPAMNEGNKIDSRGKDIIESMAHRNRVFDNNTSKKEIDASNVIDEEVTLLNKLHHARTAIVHTTLNGHIWFVLLLATFVTLGINYILGMEFKLHLFCLTLITVVISSIFYLIVGLDRPYQGDFIVHPDSIQTLQEEK